MEQSEYKEGMLDGVRCCRRIMMNTLKASEQLKQIDATVLMLSMLEEILTWEKILQHSAINKREEI